MIDYLICDQQKKMMKTSYMLKIINFLIFRDSYEFLWIYESYEFWIYFN